MKKKKSKKSKYINVKIKRYTLFSKICRMLFILAFTTLLYIGLYFYHKNELTFINVKLLYGCVGFVQCLILTLGLKAFRIAR